MASLPETDVEEDGGDVGLTIYPLQIAFNVQKMWRTLGVRVDSRSSSMKKDRQGKARHAAAVTAIYKFCLTANFSVVTQQIEC